VKGDYSFQIKLRDGKMLKRIFAGISVLLIAFTGEFSLAQENYTAPDLSKIIAGDGWKIINRKAELIDDSIGKVVHLNSQPGDGVAWLENFDFENGVIEVDIKGKDAQGSSFVGVAFRVVDEETYDAVYFRPFNFMSVDSVKKDHSVQYVSQPDYTWQKLRGEFPGKYENPVNPVPDPDSFFHAKIVIEKPKVSVYVNNSSEPSLVVDELSSRTGGWVGLWVGNYSEGMFSSLKITTLK